MAEEVHKPALNVPRAMVWSVPIGWLMGVVFILPITFTLPDVAELLQGDCLSRWPTPTMISEEASIDRARTQCRPYSPSLFYSPWSWARREAGSEW